MGNSLGWVIENSADNASPDRGEINNTGDIVETALILGRRGYTEYFADMENHGADLTYFDPYSSITPVFMSERRGFPVDRPCSYLCAP